MTEAADYTQHHTNSYYGKDHMVRTFWSSFMDLADEKVLNAGCGRAQSVAENPNWHGFDFNPNLDDIWNHLKVGDRCRVEDARYLSYENRSFDYVVSCDFLEHVKPADLDDVANELLRVAPHGRHVIDRALMSSWKTTTGETLHPAAGLDADMWVSLFGGTCKDHEKRGFWILDY